MNALLTEGWLKNAPLVQWAVECAALLLPPLGDRWLHVQGVVRRAYSLADVFAPDDAEHLVAAALLHDIGYAPALRVTGTHQLDGARFVRAYGHERLASLVAYHSEARFELALRGLAEALARYPREVSPISDALTYCDVTTSPTGRRVSMDERLVKVIARYGPDSLVTTAVRQATPALKGAVVRTSALAQSVRLDDKCAAPPPSVLFPHA